ncbi:hypothetical protein B0H14DRAFT_3706068 [Mycena olivaceomarginata]|nr:hypothetical protein B0H14DRAFT_3706068 [Mycena olivaceomarginata]
MLLLLVASLIQLPGPAAPTGPKLYFDPWNFKVGNDAHGLTGGQGTNAFARQQNLTSVNAAGNVVIKVDDFTSAPERNLWPQYGAHVLKRHRNCWEPAIMDAVHIPFGCSVEGEIDIIENVNLATNNHLTTSCFVNATGQANNEGCLVAENDLSYGAKFAQNGGGVFATLWDEEGIRVWFFTRSAVPPDMATASPNPSGWGAPSAFWPQSSCNTAHFFGPQTLILETNVCGDFARDVFSQTCSQVAKSCTDLIVTPTYYVDAYWEIKYITVFSKYFGCIICQ